MNKRYKNDKTSPKSKANPPDISSEIQVIYDKISYIQKQNELWFTEILQDIENLQQGSKIKRGLRFGMLPTSIILGIFYLIGMILAIILLARGTF